MIQRLSNMAQEKTPFFSDVWKRQEEEFGHAWAKDLSENISSLLGRESDESWENMLFGYADFSMEAVRHQKYFEEHREYQKLSPDHSLQAFYDDENFMMTTYLPGLFLSHYLWRHHYRLLNYFRQEVLAGLVPPKMFYEIGVGTGLYSCETLKAFPHAKGKGFDISRYSVDFTKKLLDAHSLSGRYSLEIADIFKSKISPDSADFLICQEVLEHLEDPAALCRVLLKITKPGSKAYITAALNAAHTDHIYLFRTPSEVEAMLRGAGWDILGSRSELAYDGKPAGITPCVAGFLCKKP